MQPYSGSSTFLPLLQSGEMEFGVTNAVDMALAYRGPSFKVGGRNPLPHTPNVRLVMRGSPFLVGLVVRKDSPIKTAHDVKGKRMTARQAETGRCRYGAASSGPRWPTGA